MNEMKLLKKLIEKLHMIPDMDDCGDDSEKKEKKVSVVEASDEDQAEEDVETELAASDEGNEEEDLKKKPFGKFLKG